MEIKKIIGSYFSSKEVNSKNSKKEEKESVAKDKLEISDKAISISKQNTESKNLDIIRERIAKDFYNNEEVTKAVSRAIRVSSIFWTAFEQSFID